MGLFSKLMDKANDVAKNLAENADSTIGAVTKSATDKLDEATQKITNAKTVDDFIPSGDFGERATKAKQVAKGLKLQQLVEGDVSGIAGNVAESVDFKGHGKAINNTVKGVKFLGKIKGTIDDLNPF